MEGLKRKRKLGDRWDGYRLRELDPLHVFMPYLMPKRCDCEASITETIEITKLMEYVAKKNADNPEFKYTFFHVIVAALMKTLCLRPKMNRFIQGRKMYQREELSAAFVAKKYFGDEAHEALLSLGFDENACMDDVYARIKGEVIKTRGGKIDHSTDALTTLSKLPGFLLSFVMGFLKLLDYIGIPPKALVKDDPDFASVYISNLGSIKLNACYHHLNNWGTNSVFVVIGEKAKKPFYDENGAVTMRETIKISMTLDERIADGYYYAKTVKLLKYLLQNPELLDRPFKEEVENYGI